MKYILTIIIVLVFFKSWGQTDNNRTVFILKNKANKSVNIIFNSMLSLTVCGNNNGNMQLVEIASKTASKKYSGEKSKIITSVKRNENFITVTCQGDSSAKYILTVPKHLRFIVNATEINTVSFSNLYANLEINTNASIVNLNDITGPLILNARNFAAGKKTITFNSSVNHFESGNSYPINILTATHNVDFTIPANDQTSLNLNATHGEIYADPLFALEGSANLYNVGTFLVIKKKSKKLIEIRTEYGDIYLRNKKRRNESTLKGTN